MFCMLESNEHNSFNLTVKGVSKFKYPKLLLTPTWQILRISNKRTLNHFSNYYCPFSVSLQLLGFDVVELGDLG